MRTIALLGNPNVGKTTLFNILTASNQYVGNWPGVTVDKKEGYFNNIKIVDLPGIYAMDTFSNEERVSKEFLESGNVDFILNIIDASNIERNLYLTTQLKQFNIPIIVAVNMIDVAENKGIIIDYKKLQDIFNVQVVPISASKGEGINNLKNIINNMNFEVVEDSEKFKFENEKEAYKFIENSLKRCKKNSDDENVSVSDNIDKVLLNPWLAYPIFIVMMIITFAITFSWVGQPLSDLLDGILNDTCIPWIEGILENTSPWFKSLLVDGIISGVGGILVLLPVILSLFICITILEDSGYMSRVAFLMDKLMRKMGLSGKAFIPMMVGFGCSVPAIMTARTLESEKDRKITALISPLMTCGAKLPIYAVFVAIFFPKNAALVTTSLYLLGIVVAILVALVLNRTSFKNDIEPFVLELPEYKLPTLSALLKNTWNKSKGFLIRVVTVMFAMSVAIWLLSSFNFNGFTENMNDSFLAYLGKLIAPLFAPLGFGDWRASVSILTGLGAKEIVISTMQVLYGNLDKVLPTVFTGVTAYGFLVFSALYTPCIAALATMRKEYGNKMMFTSLIYQFVLAWIGAFIVRIIGGAIFSHSPASLTEFVIAGIILLASTIILLRMFNKKSSGCSSCSSCSSKGSCSIQVEEKSKDAQ